jgi:hypothetical protein
MMLWLPRRFRQREPMGCYVVRAMVFGKWREMRLLGMRGAIVHGESVDNGSKVIYALAENLIHPECLGRYREFVEKWMRGAR